MRKLFKEAFGFWGALGVIVGAVSIFNLIAKGFSLGLAPMVSDIVGAYVFFFHKPIDWLLQWFDWRIASWAKDIVAIYIIGFGIEFRSVRRYGWAFQEAISSSFVWPATLVSDLFDKRLATENISYEEISRSQVFVVFLSVLLLLLTNAGLQLGH